MQRLPNLPKSKDAGSVYVLQRGQAYKVGFSRGRVRRRARDGGGVLVLTITTGQQPASLERAIHQHFASKRLPPQGQKAGDASEWFALDASDLVWLRGLSQAQDIGVGENRANHKGLRSGTDSA